MGPAARLTRRPGPTARLPQATPAQWFAGATTGTWVVLPGASRTYRHEGGDRIGRLREPPRADGTAEEHWFDVPYQYGSEGQVLRDGSGYSVERIDATGLHEAPGTTASLVFGASIASWGALFAKQRDAQ